MRLVNYEVRQTNGIVFFTTNHKETSKNGNCIENIFFTPYTMNPLSAEQEKERLDHIEKVDKYLASKRA